ncbi:MAG: hypothetical protein L6R36_001401 [Xanthoria steineri]|nr:MAG: hypothetical protein L6R36_001401 [Xanthoria steineri]
METLPHQPPSFLQLPRELRDDIYTLLLNPLADPPPSPKAAGIRYRELVTSQSHLNDKCIFYPPPLSRNGPAAALSQCNRQLRQELNDLVTSPHRTKAVTCTIDVMLQRCLLWPTWTSLPPPVPIVDHLGINLRLFDVKYGRGLFWCYDRPGATFVVLFRALNRLLHHGPGFLYEDGESQKLKINTLTINVLHGYGTVAGPDDALFLERDDPELECEQFMERDREQIHDFISQQLHQVVSHGLLSEQIQTLRVCDGDRVQTFATEGIPLTATPPDEWIRWGFDWGVDEMMKVEKVESLDLFSTRG